MNRKLLPFALALCVTGMVASVAEPTRIYLANDDHTDYMWTADAETYNAVFVDMLELLPALGGPDEGQPVARSRFNADGTYWLWQYERRKTPAEFERLIARVKDGTISAPMNTLVSIDYGGFMCIGVTVDHRFSASEANFSRYPTLPGGKLQR